MYILGVSCDYHDSSAALLKDGQLVAAASEERFSRKKHDSAIPSLTIAWCLEHAGIQAQDLDYVAFYEKPLLKFDRILATSLDYYPRSWAFFREALLSWFSEKLWIKSRLLKLLDVPASRMLFCEHHLAHAASAFYCSGFSQAAILTVDGIGEWATATMGEGRGSGIRLPLEIRWPHSLGMLYSVFTAFLGFEVNEGEYKVMGMAPYGTPRYMDKVWKLVRVSEDGAIELDLDYFSYHHTPRRAFSSRFLTLFGEPRAPHASEQEQRHADIAASLQKVTEEILLRMARAATSRSGDKRLVMAGGVALNCVANGRIQDEAGIDELFVQPAAGDGGASLGAALWAWHTVLGRPRGAELQHISWGRAVPQAEIQTELERTGAAGVVLKSAEELLDRATEDLLSGKVIGWSQGRFEWGPRALGHRSILADPRRSEARDVVNTKIKFRETFRPFAPSLTAESAARYFEQPLDRQPTAKFMLRTASVCSAMRDQIPAVTHVDGSARPHLVRCEANPLYFDLLRRFGDASGHPVLLNTSFNLRGEPIVASAADALSTFFRSGLDVLYLENYRVAKQDSGT
ncbi:MAG: carbamoyltransferase [Bryobacteraceae bacterium]